VSSLSCSLRGGGLPTPGGGTDTVVLRQGLPHLSDPATIQDVHALSNNLRTLSHKKKQGKKHDESLTIIRKRTHSRDRDNNDDSDAPRCRLYDSSGCHSTRLLYRTRAAGRTNMLSKSISEKPPEHSMPVDLSVEVVVEHSMFLQCHLTAALPNANELVAVGFLLTRSATQCSTLSSTLCYSGPT
jgi:hypothetical protein